jgi:ferredoxin
VNKLNELTGFKFRLPTEEEWEYAARGGNKSQGYKYSGSDKISKVAWYVENSAWDEDASYSIHQTKRKVPKAYLNSAEHAAWPAIARAKGQDLKANDNCIMCGTCAKVCPMGNIRYAGKAVVFGDKCISCCACVQYCPKEAINFGKITEKRERYHNVNITVDDLNQEIISF